MVLIVSIYFAIIMFYFCSCLGFWFSVHADLCLGAGFNPSVVFLTSHHSWTEFIHLSVVYEKIVTMVHNMYMCWWDCLSYRNSSTLNTTMINNSVNCSTFFAEHLSQSFWETWPSQFSHPLNCHFQGCFNAPCPLMSMTLDVSSPPSRPTTATLSHLHEIVPPTLLFPISTK